MQTVSSLMFTLVAIEILALPILLIVWLIRKARKKPKMKWLKWFWLSFALFLAVGAATNPATWCKHEYRVVESKEASCTESGYEKSHCDLCGSDKTKAIKKLGHSMEDVRRVEPTDDKDGEYVQRCRRCGYEKTEILPMPKKSTEQKTESYESKKPEPTEEQSEQETEPEETVVDGWSGDVSDGAQMVLRQIAEDMAKKIAQNPSTVKMSLFSAGYAKNGHLYAVQQEFSCSNLMGVSETHIVKVVCESNADESKIQPFEVWLDGNLVHSQERKYAE